MAPGGQVWCKDGATDRKYAEASHGKNCFWRCRSLVEIRWCYVFFVVKCFSRSVEIHLIKISQQDLAFQKFVGLGNTITGFAAGRRDGNTVSYEQDIEELMEGEKEGGSRMGLWGKIVFCPEQHFALLRQWTWRQYIFIYRIMAYSNLG